MSVISRVSAEPSPFFHAWLNWAKRETGVDLIGMLAVDEDAHPDFLFGMNAFLPSAKAAIIRFPKRGATCHDSATRTHIPARQMKPASRKNFAKIGTSAIDQVIDGNGPVADGRRERSRTSRTRIIHATMALVRSGTLNPSAAQVAEKANVSLRSVFRHFDDKESLRREIDQILMRAYLPILREPYRSTDWRGRLEELIERRCRIYEDVHPFRTASWSLRHESPYVAEQFKRVYEGEKALLDELLPASLGMGTPCGRAVLISTGYDSWRLLRHDEGLSPDETVAAIRQLVNDAIDHALSGR